METTPFKNILETIDDTGLFSQVENMTVRDIEKYLEENGVFVLMFVIGKTGLPFIHQDNGSIKERLMVKYGFSKDDIRTLELYADGLTYGQIYERSEMITFDGVSKRLKKIRQKLGASNRTEAIAKAKDLGLI
jgi:DNA-binding NarL/FixJ family response regulator